MLKQTALIAEHRAAGAKLVDFAGWEMPVSYGSQIEEHHQVRRDAGVFDVSHMRAVDLEGRGARTYLRYLIANNIDKLVTPGKALYTCMLNEAGGVLDDLIVYFVSDTRFRLVVNAGTADKDLAWLGRAAQGHDVSISARDELAILAVQGPQARDKAGRALAEVHAVGPALAPFYAAQSGELFVARTGYTGEDGFEIMLPSARAPAAWRALLAQGVKPIGLGARDTLRLEAGMNLYGQDMDENVTPLESGLAWTVDMKSERDFVGKRGLTAAKPARQLLGLLLLDKGVLRSHQAVATRHGAGETTSGSFSPTLQRSIALARVPAAVKAGDTVEVSVRERMLSARVVRPPFVRHGKVLIEETT